MIGILFYEHRLYNDCSIIQTVTKILKKDTLFYSQRSIRYSTRSFIQNVLIDQKKKREKERENEKKKREKEICGKKKVL